MSGTHQTDFMAIVSSTFSVISVGWGLAAYTRALRKAYSAESKHREMSRPAVMVNFLWVRYSTNVPDVQYCIDNTAKFRDRLSLHHV